jgi:hypothetical protein
MTDTINSLTDEYQNYCARHGLPQLSASELLGTDGARQSI